MCAAFGLTVASTGASEKFLKRCLVTDYEKVYLHPGHHVRRTVTHKIHDSHTRKYAHINERTLQEIDATT